MTWLVAAGSYLERQARHYDGHDHMPEKRKAIEILMREARCAFVILEA